MHLIAIAWLYVALMAAVVEATSNQGSVLGALFTFVGYGVLPLSIVLYLLRSRIRRGAPRVAATDPAARLDAGAGPHSDTAASPGVPGRLDPDRGHHASGHAITPEREEP
ncbi:MAG: hypothetical protein ABIP61_07490 [Burkholderiaceae bacterium]